LPVGSKLVPAFQSNSVLISGKSGFDVIRFAFKRLPNQDPLLNGMGEPMPEPDYDSEEWKGWETRLTEQRADEVLDIKKEESPSPLFEVDRRTEEPSVDPPLAKIISVKMETED
jgi:hypothetical protein